MTAEATGSTLTHLEGSLSGETYPADELIRLDPVDGRPLLARYDLDTAAKSLRPAALRERAGQGLWRWRELLPVRQNRHITHLGEGETPLLGVPHLGNHLGIRRLEVKVEGLNPTGSFKARGMATAVSRAVELGASSFIVPSAGNAAGALAAYGSAVGKPVTVLMPVDAPESNKVEVAMMGARLILVEGLISDCGKLAAEIADRTGAFDVSTLKEPYRLEGKKTMGLELAEACGWRLPDVIVYPTGGGTGLIGMWKAFDELEALGLIGEDRPRMISVQSAGCAPIVDAFESGFRHAEPWENAQTRASGIRVPSAIGDFLILDAVRESKGTAIAVDEASISEMQMTAGRLGAGYVSPESAAALAAVHDQRSGNGIIDENSHVVVFDTGAGQKYPAPPGLPTPPTVDPDDFDIEQLMPPATLS